LKGVQSQGLEGLAAMLSRQQEILASIAREKGDLKPFLDQWEALPAGERARLRAGKPGEILEALETVAQTIQSRHQQMFGAEDASLGAAPPAGGAQAQAGTDKPAEPDLSQRIHLYRGLQ
jgi:hypothetical protein